MKTQPEKVNPVTSSGSESDNGSYTTKKKKNNENLKGPKKVVKKSGSGSDSGSNSGSNSNKKKNIDNTTVR